MSYDEAMQLTPAARMKVANLVTLEDVEVMFNPTEWEHLIELNWQRFTVPGLSHQPKHYVNTNNATFPMEFFYRATTLKQLDEMRDKMRFFESLCYPVAAQTVVSGGPPRVLFRWPKTAAIIATINSLSQRFVLFTREGRPRVARVRIEFEEIRSIRLLSDDVRRFGLVRAGSTSTRERFDKGEI